MGYCLFVCFAFLKRKITASRARTLPLFCFYLLSRGKGHLGGFAGGAFMSSLCIVSKLRCQLGWARGCTVVGTAFLMCFSLRVFLRDAYMGVSRPRHEAPLSLMVEDLLRVLRG